MQTFTAETADPVAICEELLNGPGAVRITGLFSGDQIADARARIMAHSDGEGQKVTHFQGAAMEQGRANLQRRGQRRGILGNGDAPGHHVGSAALVGIRVHYGIDCGQPPAARWAGTGAAYRLSLLGLSPTRHASDRPKCQLSHERAGDNRA